MKPAGLILCALLVVSVAVPALAIPPAPPATVTVTPADAAAIKKAIAREKGHVVLVNFWATWCGPCVAEFPALVKVQRAFKSRGLVVFAVSADISRDVDSKVKPFLVRQGARFPEFLEHASDPEEIINSFDPQWDGDLPRTFIYDKRGRLVRELSGEQTEKSLSAALMPLLKE